MDWDIFVKLCDQVAEFDDRLKQINFAGWGEPTINKNLPKMIERIKKFNVADKVSVITNGSLLTHDFTLSLIDAGVDFIKISLQGITSDKYKEISKIKLDFAELVDKIKFAYSNKGNCNIYVKIADIALNTNEDKLFYSTFANISDRMFIENIRPIFKSINTGLAIDADSSISKYGQSHPPVIVCPQPFFMMNITPEGDVYPCCAYNDPTNLGNISNTTLKEIWCSDALFDFQITMLKKERKTQNRFPVCNDCTIPDVVMLPEDDLDLHTEEILMRYLQGTTVIL